MTKQPNTAELYLADFDACTSGDDCKNHIWAESGEHIAELNIGDGDIGRAYRYGKLFAAAPEMAQEIERLRADRDMMTGQILALREQNERLRAEVAESAARDAETERRNAELAEAVRISGHEKARLMAECKRLRVALSAEGRNHLFTRLQETMEALRLIARSDSFNGGSWLGEVQGIARAAIAQAEGRAQ